LGGSGAPWISVHLEDEEEMGAFPSCFPSFWIRELCRLGPDTLKLEFDRRVSFSSDTRTSSFQPVLGLKTDVCVLAETMRLFVLRSPAGFGAMAATFELGFKLELDPKPERVALGLRDWGCVRLDGMRGLDTSLPLETVGFMSRSVVSGLSPLLLFNLGSSEVDGVVMGLFVAVRVGDGADKSVPERLTASCVPCCFLGESCDRVKGLERSSSVSSTSSPIRS
jgi:hypothetical protein